MLLIYFFLFLKFKFSPITFRFGSSPYHSSLLYNKSSHSELAFWPSVSWAGCEIGLSSYSPLPFLSSSSPNQTHGPWAPLLSLKTCFLELCGFTLFQQIHGFYLFWSVPVQDPSPGSLASVFFSPTPFCQLFAPFYLVCSTVLPVVLTLVVCVAHSFFCSWSLMPHVFSHPVGVDSFISLFFPSTHVLSSWEQATTWAVQRNIIPSVPPEVSFKGYTDK